MQGNRKVGNLANRPKVVFLLKFPILRFYAQRFFLPSVLLMGWRRVVCSWVVRCCCHGWWWWWWWVHDANTLVQVVGVHMLWWCAVHHGGLLVLVGVVVVGLGWLMVGVGVLQWLWLARWVGRRGVRVLLMLRMRMVGVGRLINLGSHIKITKAVPRMLLLMRSV